MKLEATVVERCFDVCSGVRQMGRDRGGEEP
jgi:hypothetical protein